MLNYEFNFHFRQILGVPFNILWARIIVEQDKIAIIDTIKLACIFRVWSVMQSNWLEFGKRKMNENTVLASLQIPWKFEQLMLFQSIK